MIKKHETKEKPAPAHTEVITHRTVLLEVSYYKIFDVQHPFLRTNGPVECSSKEDIPGVRNAR